MPPPHKAEGELDRLPPHFRQLYERRGIDIDPYRPGCAAHYYGLIETIDYHLGRVLDALRDNRLEDNTVVIFTADHGEALGDHGMWGKGPYHFDSVIRVPFLIKWPQASSSAPETGAPGTGHSTSGRTCAGVVSLLDFAPTILDLAGVPIPEGPKPPEPVSPHELAPWPGRSLAPILRGDEPGTTGTALVEDDQDGPGFRLRTFVTERYRLAAYSGQSYGELFDLQEDPGTLRNLWDEPGYRTTRDELRLALLDKIMEPNYALPRRMGSS